MVQIGESLSTPGKGLLASTGIVETINIVPSSPISSSNLRFAVGIAIFGRHFPVNMGHAAAPGQNEPGRESGWEEGQVPGGGWPSPAVCVEKDIQRRAEVVRSSGVPGSSGRAVVRATHVLSGQHPGRRRPQHWL